MWRIALTAQDVFCLKTKGAASVPVDIMLTDVTKVGTFLSFFFLSFFLLNVVFL